MRKRRTERKLKTIRKAQIRLAAGAFAVTWVVLLTSAALTVVCSKAAVNGYLPQEQPVFIRQAEPMRTELCLFGEVYAFDWTPINEAAGALQPYFALLPAPMRLPYQLFLLGEERYREAQKEQRAREFIENI